MNIKENVEIKNVDILFLGEEDENIYHMLAAEFTTQYGSAYLSEYIDDEWSLDDSCDAHMRICLSEEEEKVFPEEHFEGDYLNTLFTSLLKEKKEEFKEAFKSSIAKRNAARKRVRAWEKECWDLAKNDEEKERQALARELGDD